MKKQVNKILIGRVDKADLPEFGFENIDCKIDTGADISSIHCSKVKLLEKDGVDQLNTSF
ncbi:RimK/LysX family protein [Candidatus Kapabacteria bacterium]|nr:RimK/LysX family protein [Candidatus Kapabacteria bacterium]